MRSVRRKVSEARNAEQPSQCSGKADDDSSTVRRALPGPVTFHEQEDNSSPPPDLIGETEHTVTKSNKEFSQLKRFANSLNGPPAVFTVHAQS